MAFFPRAFFNTNNDASFTPLFRLLDDFDSYSRQSGSQSNSNGQQRRSCLSAATTWQPKFDVRETGDAYELHGELPGMDKENVDIEFTEPQTMLIRGKVERTYTAGTSPNESAQLEGAAKDDTTEEEPTPSERRNSHQATVEDEEESESHEAGWEEVTSKKNDELQEVEKPVVDNAKYWLTERSIGEFSRSFNFPTRIDQEAVSAGLKDGILTVTVPKAKKHEARRINIA